MRPLCSIYSTYAGGMHSHEWDILTQVISRTGWLLQSRGRNRNGLVFRQANFLVLAKFLIPISWFKDSQLNRRYNRFMDV